MCVCVHATRARLKHILLHATLHDQGGVECQGRPSISPPRTDHAVCAVGSRLSLSLKCGRLSALTSFNTLTCNFVLEWCDKIKLSNLRSMCRALWREELSKVAASPEVPPKALGGGISKVNFQETLSIFGDKCPQNGSKTAPTAPSPHLGCPHEGSRVVYHFLSPTYHPLPFIYPLDCLIPCHLPLLSLSQFVSALWSATR